MHPLEILIHRVIWSVVLLLVILIYTRQVGLLRISVRQTGVLFCSSMLLSANWLIFIYAVTVGNIVEAALGYFINPLVSVLLAMLFLGERLRPLQLIALGLSGFGICIQLYGHGQVPLIALGLAFSFGFYGLIRKRLTMSAVAGLCLETMMALPFALLGLAYFYQTGQLIYGLDVLTTILLSLGGLVTSFPLLCFAAAVNRLSLTALGMFQYIAPSLSLGLAVLVFDEAFGVSRAVTFGFIWCALIIFTVEAIFHQRRLTSRMPNLHPRP